METNNDATLSEIRDQLQKKTGIMIGRSTVDRMLQLMGISLKKRYTLRKKKQKEFSY